MFRNIPPVHLIWSLIYMIAVDLLAPKIIFVSDSFCWSGMVLVLTGIYVVMRVRLLMRKHGTTHKYEKSTTVVQESYFSFCRNPMYSGMMFVIFGISILMNNAWTILGPIYFFLILQLKFIPFEEEKMAREIGAEYLEYKKKVRRWF